MYKSRDLMQKSTRFCNVAHSKKIIEILLSHIRDKNKFKNRDSLFPLIQCFKTNFCYIFYSMFYDYYLFNLIQYFKTFHLFHTHKIFAFPFSILISTHLYTYAHSHSYRPILNTLRQKTILFTFNLSTTPT